MGRAPPGRTQREIVTRVILVDDHAAYRKSLRAFLEEIGGVDVVAEAEDGASAIRLAGELRPDVVLMDIALPGPSGVEATRGIVASFPEIKIIALSMHGDRAFRDAMHAAGASGYVLKDDASRDLGDALRSVAAGGTHFPA